MRKIIAKAMQNSLSTTAQLTLNASFDATDILNFRKRIKKEHETLGLHNITINDMIVFALSRTLITHKVLNSHLVDDKLLTFKNVHIGIAVDTTRGLMVPTLFNTNKMSLDNISLESKSIATKCNTNTIPVDLLQGASFTLTNLGNLQVENFTPVLNPPQIGILGVGSIVKKPIEIDGEIKLYSSIGLSLTFDHRAIDGAPAARFLRDLKVNLENFNLLLSKG
jgi:pyruvate dehydrogenase E2 component (dihydrolipoamide acetyltransferase)